MPRGKAKRKQSTDSNERSSGQGHKRARVAKPAEATTQNRSLSTRSATKVVDEVADPNTIAAGGSGSSMNELPGPRKIVLSKGKNNNARPAQTNQASGKNSVARRKRGSSQRLKNRPLRSFLQLIKICCWWTREEN